MWCTRSLLWLTLSGLLSATLAQDPVVTTDKGSVRGRTVELKDPKYDGIQVDSFYNIPFGNDTGGNSRFKWPIPADPWTEEIDGSILGPACPQGWGPGMNWFTHPFWPKYSEDCLNLNVHTPTEKGNGPYAVMVWFHGGAYVGGFNNQYPGHFLAANDVVVVVPNYRMNAFGFLSAEDPLDSDSFYGEAPGNAGMMDQTLALQWVQDNIHLFGGNKDNVTIFGQSAGSSSASLHMMSPHSTGLFHNAIMESGTDRSFWAVNWPEQQPNNYGQQVAVRLGCETGNSIAMIDCLRGFNWTTLVSNSNISCSPGHFCQGFAPIVDGIGGFLPDYPGNLRAAGAWNKVPIITGLTREDGSLYTLFLIPESNEPGREGFTHDEFHHHLEHGLLYMWKDSFTPTEQVKLRNAIDWFYSPWPHLEDLEGNRQAFNKMITDQGFGVPTNVQARDNFFEQLNTYVYVLGMRPENTDTIFDEWLGVPHMGELPHVWGWPLLRYNPDVRASCKIFFDIVEWTCDEDMKWSYFFQEMWTNFAKYSNPTPPGSNVQLPDTVAPDTQFTWEAYEFSTTETDKLAYMYADNEDIHVGYGYRQREYAFTTEYGAYLGNLSAKHNAGGPAHSQRLKRSTARPMKMGVFSEGMRSLMEKALKERVGEQNYLELLEGSMEWTDDQQYWDIVTPQTGIGRNCDGELPFPLPTGVPPIVSNIPGSLPVSRPTLPPLLPSLPPGRPTLIPPRVRRP